MLCAGTKEGGNDSCEVRPRAGGLPQATWWGQTLGRRICFQPWANQSLQGEIPPSIEGQDKKGVPMAGKQFILSLGFD